MRSLEHGSPIFPAVVVFLFFYGLPSFGGSVTIDELQKYASQGKIAEVRKALESGFSVKSKN